MAAPWKSPDLLTNHAHVLSYFSANRKATVREASFVLHLTERTVLKIVGELRAGGLLQRTRSGRGATSAPNCPREIVAFIGGLERFQSAK